MESLLTQMLIIHIIRTAKIPFIQSRASTPLIATTIVVCAIGIALPSTWVGEQLGFTTLSQAYWFILAAALLSYATLTHLIAVGAPASTGVASGRAVFESARAVELTSNTAGPMILIRPDTSTDDVSGFAVSAGILTASGGRTARAAVVARQLGKGSVVG